MTFRVVAQPGTIERRSIVHLRDSIMEGLVLSRTNLSKTSFYVAEYTVLVAGLAGYSSSENRTPISLNSFIRINPTHSNSPRRGYFPADLSGKLLRYLQSAGYNAGLETATVRLSMGLFRNQDFEILQFLRATDAHIQYKVDLAYQEIVYDTVVTAKPYFKSLGYNTDAWIARTQPGNKVVVVQTQKPGTDSYDSFELVWSGEEIANYSEFMDFLSTYATFYDAIIRATAQEFGPLPDHEVILSTGVRLPSGVSFTSRLEQVEREKAILERIVLSLSDEKDSLEKRVRAPSNDLHQANAATESLRRELAGASARLESQLKKLEELERVVTELRAQLSRQKNAGPTFRTSTRESTLDSSLRTLGVDPPSLNGLSREEKLKVVNAQYKVRSMIYHPDRQAANTQRAREAETVMKAVNEAVAFIRTNI